MIRTVFLLGLFITIGTSGYGQGSSIQIGGGYGFPIATGQLYANRITTSYPSGSVSVKEYGTFGSYGAGFNVAMSFTKMFSKYLGVDLGVSYLFGTEYEGMTESKGSGIVDRRNYYSSLSGLFLSPVIVIQGEGNKVTPYVKAGMTLGFVSLEEENSNLYDTPTSIGKSTVNYEYTGRPAIGYRGGVGFSFGTDPQLRWFAEAMFSSLTYYPAEAEITNLVINNDGQLHTLTVRDKKVVFVDEVTTITPQTADPTKPREAVQVSFPLSSLQINVGVRFMIKPK